MDLQKKLKDVNAEEKEKGPSTVNNALFVGSTAELAKMLKSGLKENNKQDLSFFYEVQTRLLFFTLIKSVKRFLLVLK